MASQINLGDTLEALESIKSTNRLNHLKDLQHVVQHNIESRPSQLLDDTSYQRIFQTLFKTLVIERKAYIAAKTPSIKNSASTRLSACTSTLRFVLGVSLHSLKLKTVKFLASELLKELSVAYGSAAEQVALDAAKSLRILFQYLPHVEHLQHDFWEKIVSTCISCVDGSLGGSDTEGGAAQDVTAHTGPAQRPVTMLNGRRQRSLQTQIHEEVISCLRALTTSPSLDLLGQADELLRTTRQFLSTATTSSSAHEDGFGLINNILSKAMTEDTRLIKISTGNLLQLTRKYWNSKLPGMKAELVIMLVKLQPFVLANIKISNEQSCTAEVKALYDVILAEYSKRALRDQMQLEELRLQLHIPSPSDSELIRNALFALRTGRLQEQSRTTDSEQNWALMCLLADWVIVNAVTETPGPVWEDDDDDIDQRRSRKRMRMSTDLDNLLDGLSHGTSDTTHVSLQLISFLAQRRHLSTKYKVLFLAAIRRHAVEASSRTMSWALTAASSMAMQIDNDDVHNEHHSIIWQIACRAMANAGTCRAACHYLHVMLKLKQISPTMTSELIRSLAESLDLSGPSSLCDSSLQLLKTCILVARTSQQSLAGSLTLRTLAWVTRKWTPSRFDLRTQLSANDTFEIVDVANLLTCALEQSAIHMQASPLPEWGRIGAALVQAAKDHEIADYLLIHVNTPQGLDRVMDSQDEKTSGSTQGRDNAASSQELLLAHIIEEVARVSDLLKDNFLMQPQRLTIESSNLFSTTCFLAVTIAHDFNFLNRRQVEQLQRLSSTLLNQLCDCAAKPECSQDAILSIIRVSASQLCTRDAGGAMRLCIGRPASVVIAKHMTRLLDARKQHDLGAAPDSGGSNAFTTSDLVSQDSHGSAQSPTLVNTQPSSSHMGTQMLRASVSLYALVLSRLNGSHLTSSTSRQLSPSIARHILDHPIESAALMLRILARDLIKLFSIDTEDLYLLLEMASSSILGTYAYDRSEIGICAIVELMARTVTEWTDPTKQELSKLGLDVYEWLTEKALPRKILSSTAQQRAVDLLLAICHQDLEFGSESTGSSARTRLFWLLRHGTTRVHFYLAPRLPSVFGLYAVSVYDQIFEDLQQNLPIETTWLEGIAMRLYVLAELGSTLHSLLRQCVYYIFETAGQISFAVPYAKRCIDRLTGSLELKTSSRLFALFSPQLLHTWLNGHKLQDLPFAVFGYATLDDFLYQNKDEIAAQLFLRDLQQDLEAVALKINMPVVALVSQAFDRVLAYGMSWDIANVTANSHLETCESRLRSAVGGKEKFKRLVRHHYPAIIGRMLLATNRDDNDEKWLEKREGYTEIAAALALMKKYGQSERALPPSQEPHFKSKYLIDQLERLARRLGHSSMAQLWSPSTYVLASQMLFDSADEALGSSHACAVLQTHRILIAMADQTPLSGYALENTIRMLLGHLTDEQCADDAVGMLRYLFSNGLTYLVENWTCLWSSCIRIVLLLSKFEHDTAKSQTQSTQLRETLAHMRHFKTWLLSFLANTTSTLPKKRQDDAGVVLRALSGCKLPGNAVINSPESTLMLFLLRQDDRVTGLLMPQHLNEALKLLAQDFETSPSLDQDCLQDTSQAASLAQRLWTVSQSADIDKSFVLWSATVMGRAFAATGNADLFLRPDHSQLDDMLETISEHERSHALIAHCMQARLECGRPRAVSIALSTLRACFRDFDSTADLLRFQRLFPAGIVDAVEETGSEYQMASTSTTASHMAAETLMDVFRPDADRDLHEWTTKIGLTVCSLSRKKSFLKGLSFLLKNDNTAAMELLPGMLHIVLSEEGSSTAQLHGALSSSLTLHFDTHDLRLMPQQRFLIEFLLYLMKQPYPGETTETDRMKWIDCDFLKAASCAARCKMPATSLFIAELARTTPSSGRRASSRTPLQHASVTIPDDLLLSIFQQVNEPDSYYGVEQPATLESYLNRSIYEGNALQALVARSARLGSLLSTTNHLETADTADMMQSLSALNLDSLTFAIAQASSNEEMSGDVLLDTARVLGQWNVNASDQTQTQSSTLYNAFSSLSRATDKHKYLQTLEGLILEHAQHFDHNAREPLAWASALSALVEIMQIVTSPDSFSQASYDVQASANSWMALGAYDGWQTIVRSRHTSTSVLAANRLETGKLSVPLASINTLTAKSLVMLSDLARKHDRTELAVSAAWQLSDLAQKDLQLSQLAKQETASVLCAAGESAASIKLLRELLSLAETEDNGYEAGLLSQIGQQLADARLEKPTDILQNYLRPSINKLTSQTGPDAGKVFYTFATFCDAQLQSSSNLADFQRVSKLRQAKLEEIEQLKAMAKAKGRSDSDKRRQTRELEKATSWYEIDNEEYQRLKRSRDVFAEQSLDNYMRTLKATDTYDLCVLRLFALWLEHGEIKEIQNTVSRGITEVPSWKFVVLMNQLMSRLKGDKSDVDTILLRLLKSVCGSHPYHTVHHLYAARKFPGRDTASQLRRDTAEHLIHQLIAQSKNGAIIQKMVRIDSLYKTLAEESNGKKNNGKYDLAESPSAMKINKYVPRENVPPATIDLPLQPDGRYENVPVVTSLSGTIQIMTGLSAPKVLTMHASDGSKHRQLFKGGNDDLRQDAIMEQVFGEVSKMLRNHKASRQRHLRVRTYKVIPLTNKCGIIEFVPDSIPLNDFLQPAHLKYYPSSLTAHAARSKIGSVSEESPETRVKVYRDICNQMPPVLRYFFFERFKDPDEWFAKRTAYTRTTATISMLGQILGLGDRHCHNILLDEKRGDVIHIDLGVAFEAGRVLPIPELVPFRLTRDIIDGMGVTGTDGIFKRCSEFTLDALRKDKDSIMTLLNVLRYDPLYSWTLSPLRAKRMQQQQEMETDGTGVAGGVISNNSGNEAAEAERALSIVEKKLGNALSTAASVSELIQQATDERNLATLFNGWAAFY